VNPNQGENRVKRITAGIPAVVSVAVSSLTQADEQFPDWACEMLASRDWKPPLHEKHPCRDGLDQRNPIGVPTGEVREGAR
jgi:hypothetical protein